MTTTAHKRAAAAAAMTILALGCDAPRSTSIPEPDSGAVAAPTRDRLPCPSLEAINAQPNVRTPAAVAAATAELFSGHAWTAHVGLRYEGAAWYASAEGDAYLVRVGPAADDLEAWEFLQRRLDGLGGDACAQLIRDARRRDGGAS